MGTVRALLYDLSVHVHRPVTTVFAVLADIQDYAVRTGSPIVRMGKSPAGPTVVGTTWREVVRVAPGIQLEVQSLVTAVDPHRYLEMIFRGPAIAGRLRYELEPISGGTLLRQREVLELDLPLSIFAAAIDRTFEAHLRARLDDIRRLIEEWPPAQVTHKNEPAAA